MKALIATFSLLFSVAAHSITIYDAPGHALPDEMSPDGLPEVIPCATRKAMVGYREAGVGYECIWLSSSRMLSYWDQQQNKEVRFYNQQNGKCHGGRCFAGGQQVGGIPMDSEGISISIWYYMWLSSDSKVVAYLKGHGPAYGGEEVTYVEAAQTLHQFYLDSGLTDEEIKHELDLRVDGGYASVAKDDSPVDANPAAANGMCLDDWIAAFRKEAGEDAMIGSEQLDEWKDWCSEGKRP